MYPRYFSWIQDILLATQTNNTKHPTTQIYIQLTPQFTTKQNIKQAILRVPIFFTYQNQIQNQSNKNRKKFQQFKTADIRTNQMNIYLPKLEKQMVDLVPKSNQIVDKNIYKIFHQTKPIEFTTQFKNLISVGVFKKNKPKIPKYQKLFNQTKQGLQYISQNNAPHTKQRGNCVYLELYFQKHVNLTFSVSSTQYIAFLPLPLPYSNLNAKVIHSQYQIIQVQGSHDITAHVITARTSITAPDAKIPGNGFFSLKLHTLQRQPYFTTAPEIIHMHCYQNMDNFFVRPPN
eukprot:TRINITY_DN57_c0_g1_i12.p1 TRINITY_DN57_c0_g1~~TRINITY_DN57_c0_g1_i12.p1  ORF type:complete len:323 (+),score=-13.80 TRINITY_DN57_c0_g1_i12:103-969(+)